MTTWTFKADAPLEEAVKIAMAKFGYLNKAELLRDALREFLLRRGINSFLGEGCPTTIPGFSAKDSLRALQDMGFSFEEVEKALKEGSKDLEQLLRGSGEF